jgi:hypothetical protein
MEYLHTLFNMLALKNDFDQKYVLRGTKVNLSEF